MTHNEILRSLRFLLDVNDVGIATLFSLGGHSVSLGDVDRYLRKDDDPMFLACPDDAMAALLEGIVVQRRGKRVDAPPPARESHVTNNTVLKKLRVAYELKDTDVIALMAEAGIRVSKPELSALFRHPDHANYRVCGDQFLRNFLKALTARTRR